jgi:hypothetical protein
MSTVLATPLATEVRLHDMDLFFRFRPHGFPEKVNRFPQVSSAKILIL